MLEIMESICVCYGFLVIRLTWNWLFTGSVLYVIVLWIALSGGRKIHLFGFVMVACFSVLVVADQRRWIPDSFSASIRFQAIVTPFQMAWMDVWQRELDEENLLVNSLRAEAALRKLHKVWELPPNLENCESNCSIWKLFSRTFKWVPMLVVTGFQLQNKFLNSFQVQISGDQSRLLSLKG